MGVSGCGKSTIAEILAKKFSYRFIEADDFHSVESKARMASGKPLDDQDRAPWIKALRLTLHKNQQDNESCVMSFSGLRAAHRESMRTIFTQSLFLHLKAPKEVIAQRISTRQAHFMPSTLLDSQFDALQTTVGEPDVICINASTTVHQTIDQSVIAITQRLNIKPKEQLRIL